MAKVSQTRLDDGLIAPDESRPTASRAVRVAADESDCEEGGWERSRSCAALPEKKPRSIAA